jgi:hypothetical protein
MAANHLLSPGLSLLSLVYPILPISLFEVFTALIILLFILPLCLLNPTPPPRSWWMLLLPFVDDETVVRTYLQFFDFGSVFNSATLT